MDHEKYGKCIVSRVWDDLFENVGIDYDNVNDEAEKVLEAALKVIKEGKE